MPFLDHVRRVALNDEAASRGNQGSPSHDHRRCARRGADDRPEGGVPNTDLVAALRDQHLLSVGAGDNVVRLLPPLIITEADAAGRSRGSRRPA
jgi:acetylornithine/N-succinyldiaminopimelate aminotransferase